MPRHKGQRRREARDVKYAIGFDPGVDGGDLTIVAARRDPDGTYTIEQVRNKLRELSTEELGDMFAKATGQPVVIEGESVPVETDPSHLLDAGGSEP